MRHDRSAAQLLVRLRAAGLAQYRTVRPGPLAGPRAVRLWTLTPAGHAILTSRGLGALEEARTQLPFGEPARWPDVAHQRDTPMLVVAYRLLAHVARDLDQPVRVAAWEHPWIRTHPQTATGHTRHVRLPAAAVLSRDNADGEQPRGVLLLPDLGTLPVASYRDLLRGLIELRQTTPSDDQREPCLIVGVAAGPSSDARAAAWQVLLQQVARRAGEQPLRVRVLIYPEGLLASGNKRRRFGDQSEQVLGLVARHPLLSRQQLAMLLGTSEARASRLVLQLRALGWVRTIRSGDVPPDMLGQSPGQRRGLAVVELTPSGRREAARRLLLPASVAARHHGLLGNDSRTRRFFRHLAHTLGANAVFVAFVSAAGRMTERGGDEALEEWRSAAACASGRFRPDGYGCYRRDGSRFGFFLEFDRGTEKPREYAAKLAAYYRYRDSNSARRAYIGLPTLLVVTTSATAEARFAHQAHLAQQRHGGTPLRVFLTTTSRIEACPEGVLGPIWRSTAEPSAVDPARICWLPRPRIQRGTRPAVDAAIAANQPRRIYDATQC
jgi:Replication-relaxation